MNPNLKTPYYVIHEDELSSNYLKLKTALDNNWNNYIIAYSYKTNALPFIIKYFNNLGAYAEVVSEDEYNLAKLIGVSNNRLIYNGPIKTKESFLEALENNSIINIDSCREIRWLKDAKIANKEIGIRVNFDIEKLCPLESQCKDEGGRFGFCYENGELEKAINEIKSCGFSISGLHLHTSSKSRSLNIYKAIAQMAVEIASQYKLELSYIDIGGGFFGGLKNKPQFDDYMSLIADILKEKFNPNSTKLIVEPGMALIGAPISYVTKVIDVKDTEYNRFVITDGSRTSIDPLMTKSSYFHSFEKLKASKKVSKQIICGYTCMEHDRLFTSYDTEELMEGDFIIYNKVGAYSLCLTPLFIKYFPDVYLEKEGELKLVRKAWTANEFILNSIDI